VIFPRRFSLVLKRPDFNFSKENFTVVSFSVSPVPVKGEDVNSEQDKRGRIY
jgi:hypothetical protein